MTFSALDDNILSMNSKLDSIIIECLAENQGMKTTPLACEVVAKARKEKLEFENKLILERIYGLAHEGRIVEIEFIVPSLPERTQSFFFPQATEIYVDGKLVHKAI